MIENAPDKQLQIAKAPLQCYTDDSLTLGELRGKFGDNAPVAWLLPQLTNLSEYCGAQKKLQGNVLRECAEIIATNWYYLKTSELMLFFYKFKCGKYGRFYGTVDPIIITEYLNMFVYERNIELNRIEEEQREKQLAERKEKCVTREEYLLYWKDKFKE